MNPRPRALRGRLLLALAGVLLPLAGTEVVLRLAGYDPLGEIAGTEGAELFVRPATAPDLVYEPAPGVETTAFGQPVKINALGFRDREFAREKPAGVRRLVAIGDSITFGHRLTAEQSWPKALERLLQKEGDRWQVLNLGVTGYDTLEEAAFLDAVGVPLAPDLVVMAYCVNDLGTVSMNRQFIENQQRFDSPWYRSRLVLWLRLSLDRRALLRDFRVRNEDAVFRARNAGTIASLDGDAELADLMERLRRAAPPAEELRADHPMLPWYWSTAHVGHLRYGLERLARLRDAHGFPAAVVLFPYLGESPLEEEWDLAYAVVQHECERLELPFLDLRGGVRAAGGASLRIYPGDKVHYNPKGYQMAARRILRELTDRGFLEK